MLRNTRFAVVLFFVAAVLLASCSKSPDHRKYIPKDAAVVAGVDIKSLGKTIAWNMITGSKLFQEMQKKAPQKNTADMMSGIDKAGIDALNTFYVYLKTDNRFSSGIRVTAIVPLSSSSDWESFVKKNFPNAAVKSNKGIKSAALENNMYVGWNDKLLMVISAEKSGGSTVDMGLEMETAFNISNDNSITSDKNFTKLESSGHDITLWINYEQIMNQYMSDNMASRMGGISLSTDMWKGTAFACGFDFEKGKITGDMSYYTSGEMTAVYKELGSANADKDLVDRLPKKDMDMMVALHLSMKGIKSLLDKTNMLGWANEGLSQMPDMTIDKLLDAFTGDMGFTVNELSLERNTGDFMERSEPEIKSKTRFCYVMKINKKENFQTLIDMASKTEMMLQDRRGAGSYVVPMSANDSFFISTQYPYLVVSNSYEMTKNAADGPDKNATLPPAVASQLTGHPFAMYFDVQQAMSRLSPGPLGNPSDSMLFAESRKLLTDITMTGGEFKNDAMATHLEVNFTNKEESSLMSLLNFGMRISEAMEKHNTNSAQQEAAGQPQPL